MQALVAELEQDLRNRNFSRLYLAPPEPIDWDRTSGFTYSSSAEAIVHPDLDIDEYLDEIPAGADVSVDGLRRRYIGVRYADADTSSSRWSAYSCLVYETEMGDRLCVLCEGEWYAVDKAFADRVTTEVAGLVEEQLVLPAARWGETEALYNERASSEAGFLLMDRRLVSLADGRSKIEFCDILSPDGCMIHVKRKTRSATLSHLFAQGVVASEEFVSDPEFRDRLRQVVEAADPAYTSLIPANRPMGNEFAVIYAIVTSPTNQWPRSLPFFSQLNAFNAARMVRRLGLSASLLLIPDREPE